jgi:hypothetical protein
MKLRPENASRRETRVGDLTPVMIVSWKYGQRRSNPRWKVGGIELVKRRRFFAGALRLEAHDPLRRSVARPRMAYSKAKSLVPNARGVRGAKSLGREYLRVRTVTVQPHEMAVPGSDVPSKVQNPYSQLKFAIDISSNNINNI